MTCWSDVVYNVFLESHVWEIHCNDYLLGVLHDDIMGISKGAVPHDCCSTPLSCSESS